MTRIPLQVTWYKCFADEKPTYRILISTLGRENIIITRSGERDKTSNRGGGRFSTTAPLGIALPVQFPTLEFTYVSSHQQTAILQFTQDSHGTLFDNTWNQFTNLPSSSMHCQIHNPMKSWVGLWTQLGWEPSRDWSGEAATAAQESQRINLFSFRSCPPSFSSSSSRCSDFLGLHLTSKYVQKSFETSLNQPVSKIHFQRKKNQHFHKDR